ncbi:MAG: hypothetical protein GWP08_00880 [Nitrospiraceae bacterium]|nr:hypothetical protein [Nitrospiraceae bacterium]
MSRGILNVVALTALLGTFVVPCVAVGAEGSDTKPKELNGLPLIFEESFEDGAARWKPTDAQAWAVRRQEDTGNMAYNLHKSSDYKPPVRSPLSISLIQDFSVTDFVMDLRMKQTGKEYGHRDLCLFFGHQDPSHYYYVHIATKSDAHANSIFIVNGEPRTSIATERTKGTDWATGWHDVRLTRDTVTGRIEVFFDDMDKPIMVAEDKTFASGTIGLGSFDDVGLYDDIRIYGKKAEKVGSDSK